MIYDEYMKVVEKWIEKETIEMEEVANNTNCYPYYQYLKGRVHAYERALGLIRLDQRRYNELIEKNHKMV